jgi:hypothetical protein
MPAALIPAAVQGLVGGIQTLVNSGKANRAQRSLQSMVDNYQPNKGILDFYNKALQRYNVNPYQSGLYNQQSQQIRGGTAQGIAALQDRRSGIAGISGLVQGQNDALLKAAATAEGQQAQALGQLGQATGMKAGEDRYKFENKYNLLAMKAGAANQGVNAGVQNMFGGLQGLANYGTLREFYGDSGSGGAGDIGMPRSANVSGGAVPRSGSFSGFRIP